VSTLVNGVASEVIHVQDRGLQYGDGVFRTVLVERGQLKNWPLHFAKLQHDCNQIKLLSPSDEQLRADFSSLLSPATNGVIKIIITRGDSARGYAPVNAHSTRIVSLNPLPPQSINPIKLQLCEWRLAHQPRLAGVKHLNRLDNVLAAAELRVPEFAEGLLLDEAGNVIEGTRSNVFMLKNGALFTPDLSQCGVSGVQRQRVIAWATARNVPCAIKQINLNELLAADEIWLVNSVIGIWSVAEFLSFRGADALAKVIRKELANEFN
jgi:4-amino-4-deoxychorismate lyase